LRIRVGLRRAHLRRFRAFGGLLTTLACESLIDHLHQRPDIDDTGNAKRAPEGPPTLR
jgi:hypothetical protein